MDEKKLLSLTEVYEEFDRAKFHFKESHRHALQGISSLLKIVSLIVEQNLDLPGAKAVNTVVLLIKASVDLWAARVAPDSEPELVKAKMEAYETILGVLEAERKIIIERGKEEEKREYLNAIESVIELIRKEMEKVKGVENPTEMEKIEIE